MSEALATTFRLLRETDSEAASRVLIAALDCRYPAIRDGALETLLKRRSPAGHREIIRRLHTFDEAWRRAVDENHGRMLPALREAVISSDRQLCANGCRAAVWFGEYDLIPALLIALEDPSNPNAAIVSESLLGLTGALCESLLAGREDSHRRDAEAAGRRAVAALEMSVGRFARHRRRDLVEAFILLTRRDNAVLRQILQDPYHPAFVVLVEMLSKHPHDAVIELLLSFLDDPQSPSAAISIIAKRNDPRFIASLLRKIGRDGSPAVTQNLRRMESIPWLRGDAALLDPLDDFCQAAAVRLATITGIPRTQAFSLIEYLLLNGKTGSRRAAADAFDQFRGADVNLVALQALEDGDPEVQARILVQLRGRGLPGAMARLIDALESPHEAVRETARQCLAEFTFARYLASFDVVSDEVRASTGELVRKVDAQTPDLLRAELSSAVRSRRLRGLAMARSLGMVAEVEDATIALLGDGDPMVRAQAASVLSDGGSAAADEALVAALDDPDPAVQEAAERSLHRRGQLVAGGFAKSEMGHAAESSR